MTANYYTRRAGRRAIGGVVLILACIVIGISLRVISHSKNTGEQFEKQITQNADAANKNLMGCLNRGLQRGAPQMSDYAALTTLPASEQVYVKRTLASILSGTYTYDGRTEAPFYKVVTPATLGSVVYHEYHSTVTEKSSQAIAEFGLYCYDEKLWEPLHKEAEDLHLWLLHHSTSLLPDKKLHLTGYTVSGEQVNLSKHDALRYLLLLKTNPPATPNKQPTPVPSQPSSRPTVQV